MNAARAGNLLKKSQEMQFLEIAIDEKWQGKLFRIRWEDESLNITSCFAWLKGWATSPTYTIAGMYELYKQLLPTKLYTKGEDANFHRRRSPMQVLWEGS